MKNESELKKAFCEELKYVNAIVFQLPANFRSEAGVPDTFVSHSYWQGHVEFKRIEAGVISAKQQFYLKELGTRCPLSCVVVWLPQRVEEIHKLEFWNRDQRCNYTIDFGGGRNVRALNFLQSFALALRTMEEIRNNIKERVNR